MNAQSDPQRFVAQITILNASSIVDTSTAQWYATVASKQLREHFCPMWEIPTCEVTFKPSEKDADPASELVVLMDDGDVAGALGYHDDVTPGGNPYAKVFCRTGSVLVTLTHECMEMVLDPMCDTFDLNPKTGLYHAREAADACENDTYELDGEQVSDFLLPGFFGIPPRVQTDRTGAKLITYAGTIDEPFATGHNGYQIVRDPKTGEIRQVFGRDRNELGAAKSHPAARTMSRLVGRARKLRAA